ncbi:MAG: LCP family protein [Bacilli bacterium]|nr:LCP family protein [Bacilli bacterium]
MQGTGNRKILSFIIKLFSIIALGASVYAIYEIYLLSSIENLIRYIVMGVIILFDILIIFKFRSKKKPKVSYLFFLFILSIICVGIGLTISYFYGQIDNLNKDKITYTSNMLVMSWSKANKIEDVKDMRIGILKDKKSPEGYIIPKEIIKKYDLEDDNQIVEYEDYTSMLVDMYSKELDAVFVPDSYVSMFSGITGYETINTDTRVVISQDKLMKKAAVSKIETASSGKDVTEPFTILLMGVDSTEEVLEKNAIANGDTLILITFNPKTLNATMLSIPRDSYVPIACWGGRPENKITHAAAYGNDCMINTIQNYFDVNIDYYAKMNFKGLVKLVNAVGGVEVDVPKRLCTDDSGRMKEVCIDPGRQVLMGEEALVFARNRKQLAEGTFGRDAHQQEIIKALIDKMKNVRDVTKFMEILNAISNNLDTNLTTKQILSFYNVAKDIIKKSLSSEEADLINIQQLYLDGSGQMIYDERARMVLWDYVPNKNSRNDLINAMKINLELKGHEDICEFDFSINKPYTKKVIGSGYGSATRYTLLPDFTGDTEEQAKASAEKLGLKVKFEGVSGTVVEQSYPANKRIDLIKDTLVLTLSKTKEDLEKEKKEKENKEKECDPDKDEDCESNSSSNENNNSNEENNNSNESGENSNNSNTEGDE